MEQIQKNPWGYTLLENLSIIVFVLTGIFLATGKVLPIDIEPYRPELLVGYVGTLCAYTFAKSNLLHRKLTAISNEFSRFDDLHAKLNSVRECCQQKCNPTRVFKTMDEYYEFLSVEVQGAKRLRTLNFMLTPPDKDGMSTNRKKYYEKQWERIKNNGLQVTRIVSIPNMEKLQWIREQLREFQGRSNYSIGYVDIISQTKTSMLTFVIIDDTKVCFGFQGSAEVQMYLYIESKDVWNVFMEYYKTLCGNMLKYDTEENRRLTDETLKKIEAQLIGGQNAA